MIFFPPDAGGGDGGGDGAAVAEPTGGEGGSSGDGDVISFSPPDIGEVSLKLGKGEEPPPPGKKEGAPPPAKKADEPPPKKEEAEPKGDAPVAKLRKEYEDLKIKHAEMEKKLSEGDPRLKTIETERDAAKKELADERKRVSDLEQRSLMSSEAITAQLRPMDSEYDSKAARFYDSVPQINHGTIKDLVVEYAKLPRGKADYAEKREEFENSVNKVLGGDDDAPHKRLEKTMDWIDETFRFGAARFAKVREVEANARKLATDHDSKKFGTRKTDFETQLDQATKIPDGLEKRDPSHPKVMMAKFDASLKPEQLTAIDQGIREFVELAVLGVPPRTEADCVGMSPEQITKSKAAESERVEAARKHLPDALFNGIRALRRMPVLLNLLAKYQARLGGKIEGEPPDPDAGGGGGGNSDGDPNDLTDFKQPDLSKVRF